MQRIEPVGMLRLEWYLAQILATLKTGFGADIDDWRTQLIGWEPEQQTMDEMLAALDAAVGTETNGDDSKP